MVADGQFLTPRYQIVRPLGKGGMGALYEAFDTILQATVVIKENIVPDDSMRLAFQREAQLLANLHHPSLPTCIDLMTLDGRQFMVIELIDGDDLEAIMSKSKEPIPTATVLDWARQLLDVVEYIHGESILHRDIKPSNIKVQDGRLYLLDFGLAYGGCGEMNTVAGNLFNWGCYSKKYSSPEQLHGEHTDKASDLYSLAATLYKLLTFVPGATAQRVDAEFRFHRVRRGESDPLKKIERPDLDKEVGETILQALSLEMDRRPQSAREMKELMFPKRVPGVTKSTSHAKFQYALAHALFAILLAGIMIVVNAASSSNQCSRCENQTGSFQEITSASATRFAEEAETLWLNGKYEAALTKIKHALVLDCSDPYLHFLHGEIQWDLNELTTPVGAMPDVQGAAREVIRLIPSPTTSKERTARAWAYLALSKSDEALNDVNIALEINPNSASALLIRAAANFTNVRLRNVAFASVETQILADCTKAIELAPSYPHAYAIQAEILLRRKDYNSARDALEKGAGLRQQASFYHKLGNIYFHLDELEKARANQQHALSLNPQDYLALIALGDVYFAQKDWNKATENYFSANQVRPTEQGFRKLGDAYLAGDQVQAAISSYERALGFAPNNSALRKQLALARVRLTGPENVE